MPHTRAGTGSGRLWQKPAQLWPSETGPIIPHGDGNFWKATNCPQSHNAKDQSYLDGGGEGWAGAGKGEKGSLTNSRIPPSGKRKRGLRNSTPLSLCVWKKPTHIKGKINSDKLLRRLV